MSEQDNHLADQKSPYLLQQSRASVDWHPWGEAAFAQAQAWHKPVFLSVGALTCADSQRMDREVFADPDVAELLQQTCVCIKVDREEHPEIYRLYLRVCRLLTGQGDGTLNLVLTPQQQPFFAATFLAKHSYPGHTGLLDVLTQIATRWRETPQDLLNSAHHITQSLRVEQTEPALAPPTLLFQDRALAELRLEFDDEYGGWRALPKFPMALNLLFLLRYAQRTGHAEALAMATQTLSALRHGGIWDQLGGGFHQASYDVYWRQPETPKRLTDQALLLMAYTAGWRATADPLYRQTAQALVAFLKRELHHPEGGFLTALAADRPPGTYYLWQEAELRTHLAPADWQIVQRLWNLQPSGNFQEARTGRLTGDNQLYLTAPLSDWSARLNIPPSELATRLQQIQAQLLAVRSHREPPVCDPTRRCDENGLVIAALAQAGRIFGEVAWLELATETWSWLHSAYSTPTGGLLHCAGAASEGFLDDYALTIWGLLELAEDPACPDAEGVRQEALRLCAEVAKRFGDAKAPGYFLSAQDSALVVRQKESYDSHVPAGNAVMLHNLGRLYRITGQSELLAAAQHLARTLGEHAARFPLAYLHLIDGLAELPQP